MQRRHLSTCFAHRRGCYRKHIFPRSRLPLLHLILGVFLFASIPRATSKTLLETCSLPRFMRALKMLTTPGGGHAPPGTTLIEDRYNRGSTVWRYENLSHIYERKGQSCEAYPNSWTENGDAERRASLWPLSKRAAQGKQRLLINAGEGSTASRFLYCVFERMGYNAAHNGMLDHEFTGCEKHDSCTAAWDRFDYISDSPVAYLTWPLLQTHPGSPVMLGVRDPVQWQARRLAGHDDAKEWFPAAPCGTGTRKMSHPDTWEDFMVFNTWVACIVPDEDLFVYNMFEEGSEKVATRLLPFLAKHNIEPPDPPVPPLPFAELLVHDHCGEGPRNTQYPVN